MVNGRESQRETASVEARWFIEPFEEDSVIVPGIRVSGKCTGCGICELICSLAHEGNCNPSLSGIRIRRLEGEWYRHQVPRPLERVVCHQCPGLAPCMVACPIEGALVRDRDTGAVIVDHESCIACGQCVEACPYDSMRLHKGAGKIIKCDLCGGKPKCVDWCPPEVLKYVKR